MNYPQEFGEAASRVVKGALTAVRTFEDAKNFIRGFNTNHDQKGFSAGKTVLRDILRLAGRDDLAAMVVGLSFDEVEPALPSEEMEMASCSPQPGEAPEL